MVIDHLKLYCAYLAEQKHFYTRKFNFTLVKESDKEITLRFGDSLLTFTENRLQNSYYHFALNIPYESVKAAHKWASAKVELMKHQGRDLIDFDSWDAQSIYFLDPAGNIVELIGRKNLQSEESEAQEEKSPKKGFSEKKILHLSEVGVPVFQVSSAASLLKTRAEIPQYDCGDTNFCACGNERGLFILVDKAEKTWFPGNERAKGFPLEVSFRQNDKAYRLKAESGELSIDPAEGKTRS